MTGRSSLRRTVELAFFVGAIGLLVVLVQRTGWSNAVSALGRLGLGGAALVVLLGFAENTGDAAALRAAFNGRIGFWQTLATNSTGAIINILAPWELGEVAKAALIGRSAPARETLGGVVVWNYAFKLSRPIVSLTAACAGAGLATRFDRHLVMVVLAANLLAFAPYLGLKLLIRAGPAGAAVKLLDRLRLLGDRGGRLLASARDLDRHVRAFARENPRAYATVILTQVGARLASWSALYVTVQLLGLGLSFGEVALVYAGLNVAELVLTVLPARLGAAEGAAFALFHVYGLDAETGLWVYLVLRLKSLFTNGLAAPWALFPTRRPEPALAKARGP